MAEFSNRLTAAQAERLTVLAEECAEVIKAVCKIQRHGYQSSNPDDPAAGNNRFQLQVEIAHVAVAVELLHESGDLNNAGDMSHKRRKREQLAKYLHHSSAQPLHPSVTRAGA